MNDEQASTGIEERGAPAAYLSFKTFLSAFEVFDHGIPRRLDRSIWRNQSGVVQGQIMMALRFFGMIDQSDGPKPSLERFVANKDKRAEYVGALLHHAYKSILDRDLTKMTAKMLSEEFDAYKVSGETKRKAIAFFLQAARFAELPMHPLLSSQVRATSTGSRKKRKPMQANRSGTVDEVDNISPDDTGTGDSKRFVLKSGAEIALKISANWLELPADERNFIFSIVDLLQSPSAPILKGTGEAS